VEIRHRRPDVSMTEQLLHRANVVPIFKSTRRERMTHRVRADAFRDARQSRPLPQQPSAQRTRADDTGTAVQIVERGTSVPPERRIAIASQSPRWGICDPRQRARRRARTRAPRPAHAAAARQPRARSNPSLAAAGSIVTRSFWPFPCRTMIWRRSKSRSLTRRARHSSSLTPEP
jgi:hypothetical protein